MHTDRFPRPIHILSDGDPLHAVLLDRLATSHDTTMSINPMSAAAMGDSPVAAAGNARPSRVGGWVSRQLQLDGAAGLLRDARARARPGMRYAYAKASAGRATRTTRRSDEEFITLLGVTTPPRVVVQPSEIGTLITFGSTVGAEVEVLQELRIHLGWPAQPGRDGVVSALTHRNVAAICTVIEAIGPIDGYAVGHPPLGRDDSPDRIHQRLVALAADMIDELLREPHVAMDKTPPPVSVKSTLVDRGAVDRDLRSGRLSDVINSVTRF